MNTSFALLRVKRSFLKISFPSLFLRTTTDTVFEMSPNKDIDIDNIPLSQNSKFSTHSFSSSMYSKQVYV